MKLIVSFSARADGNCDRIARHIAASEDRIVHLRETNVHGCMGCEYECFSERCKYRDDGIYDLYASMARCDKVILIVPMYGGNPCSMYFVFCERGQDYFRSEAAWDEVVRRLHIIGVYGSAQESPDFIPCLEKWFAGTPYHGRVLGLERHAYGQKMADCLLDIPAVCQRIEQFVNQQ